MSRFEKDFEEIIARLNIDAQPNSEHREKLRQEMLCAFETAGSSPVDEGQKNFQKRRFRMNRLAKIAASILIVAAIAAGIVWLSQGNGPATIAWADVQEKIRSISVVKYTMTKYLLTEDGQELFMGERKIMVDPSGRIRTESAPNAGQIIIDIADQQSGNLLVMDTKLRTATLYKYTIWRKDANFRSLKERLKDLIDGVHIELGEKVINGTIAKGYRIESTNPLGDCTTDIWINAKTAEPITVETIQTLANNKAKSIYTNFDFNIHLDESLFSTIPPVGYSLKKETIQPFTPTVDDVVFVLRICSQRNDGIFPDSLRFGDLMKSVPEKEFIGKVNRLNATLALQGEPSARYAGKGVRFGNAQKAIFWYKPKGSEMYKVIYGDLSIKEVAEADLPK